MARFSELLIDDSHFAAAVAKYSSQWPVEGGKEAIVLDVLLASKVHVQVMLDTGSHHCILDPELAHQLGDAIEKVCDVRPRGIRDRNRASYMEPPPEVRGQLYYGWKGSVTLTLVTEGNVAIEVDTPVFIPELGGKKWNMPNFIGMAFLNKIRWAVDPEEERFYLGPLGEALP